MGNSVQEQNVILFKLVRLSVFQIKRIKALQIIVYWKIAPKSIKLFFKVAVLKYS